MGATWPRRGVAHPTHPGVREVFLESQGPRGGSRSGQDIEETQMAGEEVGEGRSKEPLARRPPASLRSTRAARSPASCRPTSRSARTAPPPASSGAGAARPAACAAAAGAGAGSIPGNGEGCRGTAACPPPDTALLQGRLGGATAAGELTRTRDRGEPGRPFLGVAYRTGSRTLCRRGPLGRTSVGWMLNKKGKYTWWSHF